MQDTRRTTETAGRKISSTCSLRFASADPFHPTTCILRPRICNFDLGVTAFFAEVWSPEIIGNGRRPVRKALHRFQAVCRQTEKQR